MPGNTGKTIKHTLPTMRGKVLHSHITQTAANRLVAAGYEVFAECPVRLLGGGRSYVDLIGVSGRFILAVEVETTPRNVVVNVDKAGRIGLEVCVVTPNKSICEAVIKKLRDAGKFDRNRLRVLTIGRFQDMSSAGIRSLSMAYDRLKIPAGRAIPPVKETNSEGL